MNPISLSQYGKKSIQPSPVNQMMSEFAKDFRPGVDINLGVGYVNEDTIPYEEFAEIAEKIVQIENRPAHLLNYGGPEGSARLIESIKDFYRDLRMRNWIGDIPNFDDREMIIGVSGATSILTGIANILKQGVVITTDPLYYIYTSTLERYGFEIAPVLEEKDGPAINLIEETLERNLKQGNHIAFCYFVTVNNPTCTVISNQSRREIVECVRNISRRFNVTIPIIFDLAYEWLIHNPQMQKTSLPSVFDTTESVYEIGTLSKVFSPALRIGYMIGPKGSPLLKALVQWNSDVGFSAPLITQEISAELICKYGLQQFKRVNDGYREKGTIFSQKFIDNLNSYIETITGGDAGFYLYLTLKNIKTNKDSNLFKMLSRKTGNIDWDYGLNKHSLKTRVVYLPGEYCVHPKGTLAEKSKYQLRLSYGYESISSLIKAVDIFSETVKVT